EELLATAQLMWPGQSYHALVFGMPMPEMREASNAHVADECSRRENLYPLYIPDLRATEGEIRRTILEKGFYGFKPYWALVEGKTGEEEVTIPEMLPEACMRVAEELGLLVMIHIPGRKRLASERNIDDIRALSREYPGARIILAHLGRSYCPWSMKGGIDRLCNLPNVYWDTSVVQEATVFKIFFDQVDPAKVMYGTDLPIMQMRGRRVCINDAWVDVTRDPLGWTANRSPGNPIRGTFMTYEMVRAMREGAEAAGLSVESLKPVFFENGMSLIEAVKRSLASA
ncbi:MAG TPA: amidohydrolase family protein, partial [Spirochaetia bacterium]|nr:amidohydrolase family protein [Spirochaetia bacterium]